MSASLFAASGINTGNLTDTIHNLAIPAVGVIGLIAIVRAVKGHIASAIVMGLIAFIGLGFIGLSANADGIGSQVAAWLQGLLP